MTIKLDDVPSISEYENLVKRLRAQAIKNPTIENVLPLVVATTGCRISECLMLETTDIDRENNTISIPTLKSGKGRKRLVSVPSWLIGILDRYIIYNGVSHKLFPISRIQAWRIIRKSIGYRPHALRHSYGMYMLFKGLDPETVKRLLGHSNWKVVEYYVRSVKIPVPENPLENLW